MRTATIAITMCAGITLVSAVTGCGGDGGGDEGGIGDFAGVWSGSANIVEDTCRTDFVEFSIFFNHLVNQNGPVIVLDNGASTFQGTAEQQSFTASQTRAPLDPPPNAGACEEEVVWRYDAIERDTAQFVVRKSTIRCSDGQRTSECARTFSGSAFRAGDPRPIPIDPIAVDDGVIGGGSAPGVPEGAVSDTEI